MTSRIAVIAIDALDPHRVAAFWSAALAWEILHSDDTGASLGASDGSWPIIEIGLAPNTKSAKNRVHLDLRADGTTQRDEVRRLMELGARRVDVGQSTDSTWVVLADPEGNEFCLLSRTVQEVRDNL
jgi:hypothetical protein